MNTKTPASLAFLPLLAGICGLQTLSAAVYKVDFNTTNAGGYPDGAAAWNIYAADTAIEGTAATLKDTTGINTAGITLLATGTLQDSGNGTTSNHNGFNNITGGPSWLTTNGSLANTAAAGDYFFSNNVANLDSFTLTLANLTPGNIASLDLFFSRNGSSPEGFYRYSVDSGSTWLGFRVLDKAGDPVTTSGWGTAITTATKPYEGLAHGNNNAWYMNAPSILIGAPGTLMIEVTDSSATTGSDWSGVSAFQLTVVPEPSSALLSILGGLLVIGRRRR